MSNVPFGYEDGNDIKGAPSEPNPGVQFAEPENGWDGNAVAVHYLSIVCLFVAVFALLGFYGWVIPSLVSIATFLVSAAILSTARRSLHAISRNILGLAIIISLINITLGNMIRFSFGGF